MVFITPPVCMRVLLVCMRVFFYDDDDDDDRNRPSEGQTYSWKLSPQDKSKKLPRSE